SAHVGGEEALEVLDRTLEEGLDPEDPGVIDEDVDPTQLLACGGDNGLRRGRLTHVTRDGDDARPALEAAPCPLELLGIAGIQKDLRPFGEKAPRHVETDAAAPPRDDDSIDAVGHRLLSFRDRV